MTLPNSFLPETCQIKFKWKLAKFVFSGNLPTSCLGENCRIFSEGLLPFSLKGNLPNSAGDCLWWPALACCCRDGKITCFWKSSFLPRFGKMAHGQIWSKIGNSRAGPLRSKDGKITTVETLFLSCKLKC